MDRGDGLHSDQCSRLALPYVYRLSKSLVANWNNARKSSIAAERTKRKEKKGNFTRYKFANVDDRVMATVYISIS